MNATLAATLALLAGLLPPAALGQAAAPPPRPLDLLLAGAALMAGIAWRRHASGTR
ncbi:hypothetical protein ACT80S_05275 [Ramlibacter sp. MAHUQ-53]|uniref:hypothetical protein n=1 Tax=unclassified Ramlibacter TaxID=2617605 RepID=UPI003628479B